MKPNTAYVNLRHTALLITAFLALAACTPFQPARTEPMNTFALEAPPPQSPAATRSTLTLWVSRPLARAGFDSPRMVYVRQPHELEYFAKNQWVDTPARMLAPLLAQALEPRFHAVLQNSGGAATADLRLDTEIIRLQQEFAAHPSRIHLTLRVQLTDLASKQVLATREFDVLEDAPADDPYGGVIAANRAMQRILAQIADFAAAQSFSKR